jgi:hypothetical protein
MSRYRLSQEALLESEKLMKERLKAEGSTPQLYEAFVQDTQKQAILERELEAQENPEDEFGSGDDNTDMDAPPTDVEVETDVEGEGEDEEITDSIEEDPQPTNEALDDWLREKTQGSNSAVVRNLGELASGLAHIGIKYGPGLLNAMYKGTIWTFSRLGSVVFRSIEAASGLIEKSRNSIGKLEARINNSEKQIVAIMNQTGSIQPFTYKNSKVINLLKIGGNMNVAGNLNQFAGNLSKITDDLTSEFSTSINACKEMAKSGVSIDDVKISKLMRVAPPRNGFSTGDMTGAQVKSMMHVLYHTTDIWPGDKGLVLLLPKTGSGDMNMILSGYPGCNAYLMPAKSINHDVVDIKSLTGPQLIMVAKSAKMLIASCKELVKSQERMKGLTPSLVEDAKELFYKAADGKEKSKAAQSLARPVYLKTVLALDVYEKANAQTLVHASRVLAAAASLLEDHVKKAGSSGG